MVARVVEGVGDVVGGVVLLGAAHTGNVVAVVVVELDFDLVFRPVVVEFVRVRVDLSHDDDVIVLKYLRQDIYV